MTTIMQACRHVLLPSPAAPMSRERPRPRLGVLRPMAVGEQVSSHCRARQAFVLLFRPLHLHIVPPRPTAAAAARPAQNRSPNPIAGSLTECSPVSTRPAKRRE